MSDRHEGKPGVVRFNDRPFDWIAGLSVGFGAAVIVPSMIVLAITIGTVVYLFL